jgi:antitoxin component HigA of HigAB toxin-antitoxin module
MNIKPIKTDEDYQAALLRLELIFDAPIDTPQADEAEVLSLLIENYENEFYSGFLLFGLEMRLGSTFCKKNGKVKNLKVFFV